MDYEDEGGRSAIDALLSNTNPDEVSATGVAGASSGLGAMEGDVSESAGAAPARPTLKLTRSTTSEDGHGGGGGAGAPPPPPPPPGQVGKCNLLDQLSSRRVS